MKYNTGRKTMTGEEIKLGDIIKGTQSHKVVVLWDKNNKNFIVELLDLKLQDISDFRETLDEFILNWSGNISIEGNVLVR